MFVTEIYHTYHHHFLFSVVPQEMPKGHLVCSLSIAPSTSNNQNIFGVLIKTSSAFVEKF